MPDPSKHEAFSAHLREDYRKLFGYVLSLVHHLDDAQDIVQETCRTLWEKFDEYDDARPFCSWAFGVARRKTLQYFERTKRSRTQFDSDVVSRLSDLWDERAEEEGEAKLEVLRNCLRKLDDRQRRLVLQCYDGAASVREVAEQLGRSASSVHNSLARIRSALLTCVKRGLRLGDAG